MTSRDPDMSTLDQIAVFDIHDAKLKPRVDVQKCDNKEKLATVLVSFTVWSRSWSEITAITPQHVHGSAAFKEFIAKEVLSSLLTHVDVRAMKVSNFRFTRPTAGTTVWSFDIDKPFDPIENKGDSKRSFVCDIETKYEAKQEDLMTEVKKEDVVADVGGFIAQTTTGFEVVPASAIQLTPEELVAENKRLRARLMTYLAKEIDPKLPNKCVNSVYAYDSKTDRTYAYSSLDPIELSAERAIEWKETIEAGKTKIKNTSVALTVEKSLTTIRFRDVVEPEKFTPQQFRKASHELAAAISEALDAGLFDSAAAAAVMKPQEKKNFDLWARVIAGSIVQAEIEEVTRKDPKYSALVLYIVCGPTQMQIRFQNRALACLQPEYVAVA
jgi:hypothetical protein